MQNYLRKMRVILIITIVLNSVNSIACVCQQATIEEYFEHAEVVFTGKVLDVIEKTDFWSSFRYVHNPGEPRTITLAQIEITEIFKGLNEKLKYVSVPIDYSSCKYNFKIGDEYLIYANELVSNPGIIMTGDCRGNSQLKYLNNNEVSKLRELEKNLVPHQRSDNYDFIENKMEYVENGDNELYFTLFIISGIINAGLITAIVLHKAKSA